MDRKIYTVGQVNAYIQGVMENDTFLGSLCIRGELSNYKVYPSGHHYFSLKDSTGALRCVMFRSSAQKLRFRPENGMQVIAMGRVSVYPRDGAYQLYCTGLMAEGAGDLHVAFEQMKEKLAQKGLFDPAHKKPIPQYPRRIAVITSGAGAAIHDMLRILNKRFPLAKVLLLPVRVQGAEAPGEIAAAIHYANRWKLGDLIITGRGGGSMEDLWAFNEEVVAYAIYQSEIPVISAVGHEPDVTISDYVADLRAATPSNAAELAVPDREELKKRLVSAQSALCASVNRQVHAGRQHLDMLKRSRVLRSPTAQLDERRFYLDALDRRIRSALEQTISRKGRRFASLTASLDAMSPLKVLERGYSFVTDEEKNMVRSVSQLHDGANVTIHLADGFAQAKIVDTHEGGTEDEPGRDQ